jgi:hypothetical protein
VPAGQVQQLHGSAGSLDQRADGRPAVLSNDEVSLRKTDGGPGGPGVAEVALRCRR